MVDRYRTWRKARASNDANGCVEVCFDVPGIVAIRDSKLGGDSPILEFTRREWEFFTDGVRQGEL